MKKIFTFSSTIALGMAAFALALAPRSYSEVKDAVAEASVKDDLAALISSFKENEQYTKRSVIYLNDAAVQEGIDYFHAGVTDLRRTTYYDEGLNALFMCNYDGNGIDPAKGGYIKTGENNMTRFHNSVDEYVDFDRIFDSGVYTADYTVKNTTPNDYFYTLSDLAAIVAAGEEGDWVKNGDTSYSHVLPEHITLDDKGDYNDPYLKAFQYFAAPMLLQGAGAEANHYLTLTEIQVNFDGGGLRIDIRVSSGDSGKLVDGADCRLAEAKVYCGLVKSGFYLVGGHSGWKIQPEYKFGNGDDQNYGVYEGFVVGNSNISVKALNLSDDGNTYWQPAYSDGPTLGHNFTYNLYASKDGGLYASGSGTRSETFSITPEVTIPEGKSIYVLGQFNNWATGGLNDTYKCTNNAGTWSVTFDITYANKYEYKFVISDGDQAHIDWDSLNKNNRDWYPTNI